MLYIDDHSNRRCYNQISMIVDFMFLVVWKNFLFDSHRNLSLRRHDGCLIKQFEIVFVR